MTTTASLVARRDRALGTGAQLFYTTPLHIVRGDGVYLFDADGRRYVDMYNNVPCVGHANPQVVEAMAKQQATLNVHSRYLHEGIIEFAERLAKLHEHAVESVVFSCSGTEANEVALRMARIATGRRGIVCTNATYHGNSEAVGVLTRTRGDQPNASDVRAFPFPERYRPLLAGASDAVLVDAYLERLQREIQHLQSNGSGFAGLIVCSIFANEGLPDVPRGFMPRAAEMVRAAGGLVIADEVQAGYCRNGPMVGLRGHRLHARHRRDRQTDGQRPAARGDRRPAKRWSTRSARRRTTSIRSPRVRCRPPSAWRCSTSSNAIGCARTQRRVGAELKTRAQRTQVALCGDRRRARPRSVHRHRDGEGPRRQDARSRARGRRRQPAQGQRLSDEQRRRLRQRREDPAAAGVRTESTPTSSSPHSTRRLPKSMDERLRRRKRMHRPRARR